LAAEELLWELLSHHLQADDALFDQLEAAMALLGQARGPEGPHTGPDRCQAAGSEGAADAAAGKADGAGRLGLFGLHYKKVQTWVVRRNVSKAQQAVVKMLAAVM
jgi:hypothetical protein